MSKKKLKATKQDDNGSEGTVFKVCRLFNETLLEKSAELPKIVDDLAKFQAVKSRNPLDRFGSRDALFSSDGYLKNAVPGEKLGHCHIGDNNHSLVYSVQGHHPIVFKLYGIFTHDELGTGQPHNLRRQRSNSDILRNQKFT